MTQQEYEQQINALFDKGDYAAAHSLASTMRREGFNKGWYYMGAASNMLDNGRQAEKELRNYLQNADDADGWDMLGQILMNQDIYLEAADCFDKAAGRGNIESLAYASVCRYINAKDRMNDKPDDVAFNQEIRDMFEIALLLAEQCIQKAPAQYPFYNVLPNMWYTFYSLAAAGRFHHTHITETVTRKYISMFGTTELDKTVTERDTYMPLAGGGNLWNHMNAIKQDEQLTQSQAAAVFRRAMRLANTMDALGQKAEAAMLRFEMIFAEITLNGQRGIAQDAVWFYQKGLDIAGDTLGNGFHEWIENHKSLTEDYGTLLRKYGNQIQAAQKRHQKINFIRYYLEPDLCPAEEEADSADAPVMNLDALAAESTRSSKAGILQAIANADALALAPTICAAFLFHFAKGNSFMFVTFMFIVCTVIFLIGLAKSSAKIAGDGDRKNHQLGMVLLYLLFLIHFVLGLIGLVVCKFMPRSR